MSSNPPLLDDLALLALDALDASDAEQLEAAAAVDPQAARALGELRELAALLAGDGEPAGATLAPLAVERALAARPAGRSLLPLPTDEIGEVEAFALTVAAAAAAIEGTDGAQADAPCEAYGSVRELVAHLVAIEEYVGGQCGLCPLPGPLDADHVSVGQQTMAAWRSHPWAEVRAAWLERTAATLAHVRALDDAALDAPVSFHGQPMRLRDLLVIRTFELWTHTDDLARAFGRPLTTPDAGRLRVMTALAMDLLPPAMGLRSLARPGAVARIVLTGAGGGTWLRPLDPAGQVHGRSADVVLVADATDYCRLAANRLTPDTIEVDVEGDEALARDVLAAASAFALD